MVSAKRGRPAKAGERYPSGKLRPADTSKSPIAPAVWQRIQADATKLGLDPRLGTELGRLSMHAELSLSEVSAGFRIAEIYYRFEHMHGRSRSAAGSSFFRQFVANLEQPADAHIRGALSLADREQNEIEAKAEFEMLQEYMPPGQRSLIEQLCVENRPISPHQIATIKQILNWFAGLFRDDKKYRSRKAKKLTTDDFKLKYVRVGDQKTIKFLSEAGANSAPAPEVRKRPENNNKSAWLQVQRILRPDLNDEELEKAWAVYIALAARSDFRQEKLENAST
jgi:hypothetical protein